MDFDQIIGDLKKKIYHPVYFLSGDEPYYIDKIANYISENVLKESEKAFNQTIVYGKDTDVRQIINLAKRYPMMASHQVVIVKEAQDMKSIDELSFYLEKPLHSTILVIEYKYKKLDGRTKLSKIIADKTVFFNSDKVKDYHLAAWIEKYCKNKGVTIDDKSCNLLAEFLGADLTKISHELEKLNVLMPESKKQITPELIEKNIGISKDYNIFELTDAIGAKDIVKANRIVAVMAKNEKLYPIQMTLPSLFPFFTKLLLIQQLQSKNRDEVSRALGVKPFIADKMLTAARFYPEKKLFYIIRQIREYDMKSKGQTSQFTTDGDLLKELIFKIMH